MLHSMDTLYNYVKFMKAGPDIKVDDIYVTNNIDDHEGPPPPKLDVLQDRGPERQIIGQEKAAEELEELQRMSLEDEDFDFYKLDRKTRKSYLKNKV